MRERKLNSKEVKTEMRINESKKPFVLKIGKLHTKMVNTLPNYTILGMHDFFDIVDTVQSDAFETGFYFRETGEILETWDEPFNEPYEFEKRDTQLCPDTIIYKCHLLVRDYEIKTGRSLIYRAAMDYIIRYSIT